MDIASVRILRLALGTALSLWFSQLVGWPLSFIAAVFTMSILALPLALLPLLLNQRWVGILLVTLALFYSFYFPARGGSPVIGTFATVGLALATAVGSVSVDGALAAAGGVTVGAIAGISFVWIAHAALPDSMAAPVTGPRPAPAAAPEPDLAAARRSAVRSLVIIMPVLLWFLLSSASASYLAVMIKVASMAQQAEAEKSKLVAKSLLISTVIGGAAAIIAWQLMRIWPSLLLLTLLVGLAGLFIGPKIFHGPGMTPAAGTWSYGYLTMLIVLAPAVQDSIGGTSADVAFWSRLQMFFLATAYGMVAVTVFDAFWREKPEPDISPAGVQG